MGGCCQACLFLIPLSTLIPACPNGGEGAGSDEILMALGFSSLMTVTQSHKAGARKNNPFCDKSISLERAI